MARVDQGLACIFVPAIFLGTLDYSQCIYVVHALFNVYIMQLDVQLLSMNIRN
jgi:hypothetical protein